MCILSTSEDGELNYVHNQYKWSWWVKMWAYSLQSKGGQNLCILSTSEDGELKCEHALYKWRWWVKIFAYSVHVTSKCVHTLYKWRWESKCVHTLYKLRWWVKISKLTSNNRISVNFAIVKQHNFKFLK